MASHGANNDVIRQALTDKTLCTYVRQWVRLTVVIAQELELRGVDAEAVARYLRSLITKKNISDK